MDIATWNVNSVRARQERLLAWLAKATPEVVCLQELKTIDEAFPHEAIRGLGYHALVYGQKTYNGVAILSRTKAVELQRGLEDDPQARLLAAEVAGLQIVNVYVPNGQEVGTEKYAYKLEWMRRFREFLDGRFAPSMPLVLCGDFNVARDDLDVARPEAWGGSVLCHHESRAAFEQLLDWGLCDVFRKRHPEGGAYTWWDYRQLAFPRNDGLRLDYVLATASLDARCRGVRIDREEREGQTPSDHVPVVASFEV